MENCFFFILLLMRKPSLNSAAATNHLQPTRRMDCFRFKCETFKEGWIVGTFIQRSADSFRRINGELGGINPSQACSLRSLVFFCIRRRKHRERESSLWHSAVFFFFVVMEDGSSSALGFITSTRLFFIVAAGEREWVQVSALNISRSCCGDREGKGTRAEEELQAQRSPDFPQQQNACSRETLKRQTWRSKTHLMNVFWQ